MMDSIFISPKIKICGLTDVEQAVACVELGVDLIGLNCWPASPRYVIPEQARKIVAAAGRPAATNAAQAGASALPESITTVGVFVNESANSIQSIMRQAGMNLAQLHGDESLEYTKNLKVPFFKAFRVSSEFKLEQIQSFGQELFLLDTYSKTHYGGSGKTFDWNLAKTASSSGKLLLAGGLNPENVAEAVQKVRPWGVDVCSGVESQPGIKDLVKVKEFVLQVRKLSVADNP